MAAVLPAGPHAPVPSSPVPPPPRPWLMAALALALVTAGATVGVIGTRLFAPEAEKEKVPATKAQSEEDVVPFAADQQAAAGITVATLKAEPLVSRTWRPGRLAVRDDRVAHVCPPAEGVIREVPVKLGQSVAAGDVLVILDSRELGQTKLDAHKARIALAAERELSERTRTTMRNAEELLALLTGGASAADIENRLADKPIGEWRNQLLGAHARRNQTRAQLATQQGSGVVPEASLRRTEAEADAAAAAYAALAEELRFQAKNQVRQAELKLKDAEAAFDVAKAKLLLFGLTAMEVEKLDPIAEGAAVGHLAVKAPFAGTVVEKHAVRSERVAPQTQLFIVADLSSVWVQADIYEADLPLVRGLTGKSIDFRFAGDTRSDRTATVLYTGDLIDTASRTLTLTAVTANGDGVLKPGMFIEVGFDTGSLTPVIQLPLAAVLRHENRPFVFVQMSTDEFRRTPVTLGQSTGEKVIITAGLKAGDRVVIGGGFVLKSELLKDQMVGE